MTKVEQIRAQSKICERKSSSKQKKRWHDQEMFEKQAEMKGLTSEYEAIIKELQEMEESHSKVLKEHQELINKEKETQERHKTQMEQIRLMNDSAIIIQRNWKPYWKSVQANRKKV